MFTCEQELRIYRRFPKRSNSENPVLKEYTMYLHCKRNHVQCYAVGQQIRKFVEPQLRHTKENQNGKRLSRLAPVCNVIAIY